MAIGNWSVNKKWGAYRRMPINWEVRYTPYVVESIKGKTYLTNGVSQFSTRDEARVFVKWLQSKNRLPKGAMDKFITNLEKVG